MQLAPQMYLTRLESETDDLAYSRDLFDDVADQQQTVRAAMLADLKERVRSGRYRPNLRVVAERILAEV